MARKFKHIVGSGQSIYDLALQFYGDITEALTIIKMNDNIDGFEDDISGKSIVVEIRDNDVSKALRNAERNISTN